MSSPWIFICPSSRGIGHALTRHLLLTTTLPILATTRNRTDPAATKASLLTHLSTTSESEEAESMSSRLTVVPCDVTDESTIQSAARTAETLFPPKTHHLHRAFAMSGVLHTPPEKSPQQVDAGDSLDTLRVNTLGPLLLMKHFSEFLPKKATQLAVRPGDYTNSSNNNNHAVWLTMSARVGSISDNRLGGWYSYRASKAAVNSLTKTLDNFLLTRSGGKAMAVAYHPGTVKTDLSREFWANVKEDRLFSPEYAVERMVNVVNHSDISQRGRCWDWKNEEVLP